MIAIDNAHSVVRILFIMMILPHRMTLDHFYRGAGVTLYTVNLVIFACLDGREFVVLRLFKKSRIRELTISMIDSAHNNIFEEILKFLNW